MKKNNMKWEHPLQKRSIKETMADALYVKLHGKVFDEHGFWKNNPIDICWNGLVSWGHDSYWTANWHIHSWDAMKDCLKHGFDIGDDGCVVAKNTDK